MVDLKIRKLGAGEEAPMELLMDADPLRRAVDEYLSRGETFVARLDDEVVGIYVLIQTRPLTVELVNIAVAEKLRGQGLGQQMVKHAIRVAKSMGAERLEVGTGNSGVMQLGFYQRCGFRIVGVDRDFFVKYYPEPIVENGIPCVDMIRMEMGLE